MNYPGKGISIDVGTDLIKIISYKKNKRKFYVKKATSVKIPEGSIVNGLIEDVTVVANVIREALKSNKIKAKDVVFIISSNKLITREVSFPDLPEKKLTPLIKMNSDEYFPVNLRDYTIGYSILEHIEEDNEKLVRTSIAVVPNEIVESYVEVGKILKLKVLGIDYSASSIMSYSLLVNDEKPYMTVDLGGTRSSVAIVKNNKILLARTLNYGTKGIIETIKQHYQVDDAEAIDIATREMLIKETNVVNDEFHGKIYRYLNQILSGLGRLLDYYSTKHIDGVSTIYLTGGGSKLKGIRNLMNKYFSIETKLLSEVTIVDSKDVNYLNNKQLYANAIGAIYSDVSLMPEVIVKGKEEKNKKRLKFEIAILTVLAIGVFLYFPITKNIKLEKEKRDAQAKLQTYSEVEQLNREKEVLLEDLSFYNGIDGGYTNSKAYLDEVFAVMEKSLPTEVDFVALTNNKSGLLISCIATDKNNIANFVQQMKNLMINEESVFKDVFIPTISYDESTEDVGGYYTFTVSCTFNEGVQDEK